MSDWVRVTRQRPCPVCEKPDYCGVSADGSAVICMRVESDKPTRNGGWLHRLGGDDRRRPRVRRATSSVKPMRDFEKAAEDHERAVNPEALERWADELGVSVDSLRRLHVGWDGEAWTFPMRNVSGRIVGIRRRFPNGKKLSVTGGREGLFIPSDVPEKSPIVICEGPTDCAAMLTLGIHAIGRPSCRGGVPILTEYCLGRRVTVLADNDGSGRDGADALAEELLTRCQSIGVTSPPEGVKDVREWLQCGATEADVHARIDEADQLALPTRPVCPDWVPFPTEVLPAPMRDFVVETAAALGCDEAFVALPALAAAAGAVGLSRRIQLKGTWKEPPILWAAVVARSGTLKTPAFEHALRPLAERQTQAFLRYAEDTKEYDSQVLRYERDKADWKKHKGASEPPEKPDKPKAKRWIVSDVTVEALGAVLAENRRGVLLARDELGAWLGSFNQYKGGAGSDSAAWLELHRGGSLTIDRKTGTRITHVPQAAVSICGTIQPPSLRRALGREHFESGLAARLLLAMPPERCKRWTDSIVAQSTLERYEGLIQGLCEIQPTSDENGLPVPVDVPLAPDGLSVWKRFYNDHARRQVETRDDDLRAALSKLEGYAARFALLFFCMRQADLPDFTAETIGSEFVEAGVELARWFCHEAERVYGILRCLAGDEEQRELVDYIRSRGRSVTVRELQRGPRRYQKMKAGEIRECLDELVKEGAGRWEYPHPKNRGGAPVELFRLVDDPMTDDTTPHGITESGGSVVVIGDKADENAPDGWDSETWEAACEIVDDGIRMEDISL